MFARRTAIGVGCCALALGLAFGCGGSVVHSDDVPSAGNGGGHAGKPSGRAGSSSAGTRNLGGSGGSAGADVEPDGGSIDPLPVDAGCPMQELPPPELECDPFTFGSCPGGSGCYPFVDHPDGSGCDQQRYGTVCLPPGAGTQGSLCGEDSGDYCAPGFVCVVGQRAGKRCASLCRLGGVNPCTGGLICGELDVAGFGVCG